MCGTREGNKTEKHRGNEKKRYQRSVGSRGLEDALSLAKPAREVGRRRQPQTAPPHTLTHTHTGTPTRTRTDTHTRQTCTHVHLLHTCVSSGCLRNSLTVAVRSCSCTSADSSSKVSRKCSSCSSALSMRSAYSPMIQIILACEGRRCAYCKRVLVHTLEVFHLEGAPHGDNRFQTNNETHHRSDIVAT